MKVTTKTLTEPLFKQLSALSRNSLEVLKNTDVLIEVADQLGIDPQQVGTTSNGTSKFNVAGSNAFRALCDDGRAFKVGRGRWRLSEDGVRVASRRFPEHDYDGKTTEDQEPVVQELPKLSKTVIAPKYHTNSDIVAVAIQQTPCFGYFSSRSNTCLTCPLKDGCLDSLHAQASLLARVVESEELLEEARLEKIRKEKEKEEARIAEAKRMRSEVFKGFVGKDEAPFDSQDLNEILRKAKGMKRSLNQNKSKAKTQTVGYNLFCSNCGALIPANPEFASVNGKQVCKSCEA